jgi:hypothetical protein
MTAIVRSIRPAWHAWQDLVDQRQFCHSWRDPDERRLSAMDIIFFIVMIIAFGADAEVDRDIERVLHDVPTTR